MSFLDSIRILGSSANFSDRFWAKNMNAATSFTSKNGTNILIFQTSKNKEPIYSFCADFYEYIGTLFLDGFGDADSLNKMGSYLQILSELVSKPGVMG